MRVLEFNHTRIAVELSLEEARNLAISCRGNQPEVAEIKDKLEQYCELVVENKRRESKKLLNLRQDLEREKDLKDLHVP